MGAHVATTLYVRTQSTSSLFNVFILGLLLLSSSSFVVISYGDPSVDGLLKFKNSLTNNSALKTWDPAVVPCEGDTPSWVGVLCYSGLVWGLQLEGMNLKGVIDIDALTRLPYLRSFSVMNNNFDGPWPEIWKLGALKSLYLSNNRFSGDIPDDAFLGLGSLKKVFISDNAFTGKLPTSLTALPRLLELRVNDNQFEGTIPDFTQTDLRLASFANNNLEGLIPSSLSDMDASSFAGNRRLCGPPLDSCPWTIPALSLAPSPSIFSANNLNAALRDVSFLKIIIAILSIAFIFMFIAFLLSSYRRKKEKKPLTTTTTTTTNDGKLPGGAGISHPAYSVTESDVVRPVEVVAHARRGGGEQGKLTFLKEDVEKFDLQDLLKASAEVLGSGNFGASYKAGISNGAMVVKRYKLMNNVGREEFHEHMRRLGRLKHQNVLPYIAYYYRKEEKLLVTQFMENNSLASHLHANRSPDQPGFHWNSRLKIIKGITKGLTYLYNQLPSLNTPHGHLKSSNVLLDDAFNPLLTDYGLRPVMNSERAHKLMIAYKSPEYAKTGNISRKSDVWCLGILILELLTGKYPENYLTQGYDSNASLSTWVSNMVKEKRTGEVFDKDMTGTKDSKSEMINLLKIGLSCCEEDVNERMELQEVVEQIELLEEGDSDDEYSPQTKDVNMFTSRVSEKDLNSFR